MRSHFLLWVVVLGLAASCKALIANHDQHSYELATSLKVDAINLMNKATDEYGTHKEEVALLMSNVQKAYEYTKGIPDNSRISDQWAMLADTTAGDNRLLGYLFVEWRQSGRMRKTYLDERKPDIVAVFDSIIKLESAKIKRR